VKKSRFLWLHKKGTARCCRGQTLIELVVFLVIAGVIATTILLPLQQSFRNTGKLSSAVKAMEIAQQRLELITAQYKAQGFSSFSDVCELASPPAVCNQVNSSYTITSQITPNWGGNTRLKQIVVTALGPNGAKLTTLVADIE